MAGIAGFSRLRTLHCVTLESAAPLRSLPTSLQSLIVSVGSQLDINQGAVDAGGDPESPSRLPRVGFGPVQLAYLTHLTSLTSKRHRAQHGTTCGAESRQCLRRECRRAQAGQHM